MTTTLTGSSPKDTYDQLLHVSDGPDVTEKTVYSGTGVATALKVGTGSASVDNVKIDGNTISTTDTNGNLTLAPNGTGNVAISNAAITGGSITGITDLAVADGGTGASSAAAARTNLGCGTMAAQDSNNVSISGGTVSGVSLTGSFSGITAVTAATVSATSSLGYSAGAGGTVTQATSKSTGVTLNKATGSITMNNATLNSATSVSFTLTNSTIAATDVVVVNIKSGATAGSYDTIVDGISAGSCVITLRNYSGGSLSEAVVLNFVVLKGVTS